MSPESRAPFQASLLLLLLAAAASIASSEDPAPTEAPADATSTTAPIFECYYCGAANLCDHPFIERNVGRPNKTGKDD